MRNFEPHSREVPPTRPRGPRETLKVEMPASVDGRHEGGRWEGLMRVVVVERGGLFEGDG